MNGISINQEQLAEFVAFKMAAAEREKAESEKAKKKANSRSSSSENAAKKKSQVERSTVLESDENGSELESDSLRQAPTSGRTLYASSASEHDATMSDSVEDCSDVDGGSDGTAKKSNFKVHDTSTVLHNYLRAHCNSHATEITPD